jgi:hypothetical protein
MKEMGKPRAYDSCGSNEDPTKLQRFLTCYVS